VSGKPWAGSGKYGELLAVNCEQKKINGEAEVERGKIRYCPLKSRKVFDSLWQDEHLMNSDKKSQKLFDVMKGDEQNVEYRILKTSEF